MKDCKAIQAILIDVLNVVTAEQRSLHLNVHLHLQRPGESSNIKRLRKLPRNKNGEIDVHELIKESRPPVTSVPHLEALLQPCCKAPFHQVRVA